MIYLGLPIDLVGVANVLNGLLVLRKTFGFFAADECKLIAFLAQSTQIRQYLTLPQRVGHAVVGKVEDVVGHSF